MNINLLASFKFLAGASEATIVILVTPPERTAIFNTENRSVSFNVEDRTISFDPENREVIL